MLKAQRRCFSSRLDGWRVFRETAKVLLILSVIAVNLLIFRYVTQKTASVPPSNTNVWKAKIEPEPTKPVKMEEPVKMEDPIKMVVGPARARAPVAKIHHQWKWSNDKRFNLFDTYFAIPPSRTWYHPVLLGDGWLPVKFPTDNTYETSLVCRISTPSKTIEVPVDIVFWRTQAGTIKYRTMDFKFVSENESHRYQVQWIVCKTPESLSPKELLDAEISLETAEFSVKGRLPSHFEDPGERQRLAFCQCPLFGMRDTRFFIEWFEYHKVIGIDHVHVYNRDHNKESDPINSALQEYVKEGFVTEHDWSKEESDSLTLHDRAYQSNKYLMMADCVMRNREKSDYVIIGDIDEIVSSDMWDPLVQPAKDQPLVETFLSHFDKIRASDPSKKVFNFNSRTVLPVADPSLEGEPNLMLTQMDVAELVGLPMHSKGKYHYGRQKFAVFTGENGPMYLPWTHGITHDLNYDDGPTANQ